MEPKTWNALFAGDVLVTYDRPSLVSDELRTCIQASTIASCNLEAPLQESNTRPIPKAGPHMQQHPSTSRLVRDAGFNVITLANNHIYDYGQAGLEHTIEQFSDKTVIGAGTDFVKAYQAKEFQVGDVTIGLMAFCESEFGALTDETEKRGGYAWVNHPSVNGIIAHMKQTYDVVLVQVHAGIECIEQPLPEWRARYKELVDAGADAVIGSHPHVVQGWEMHAGKPIFYSLGNFSFDRSNADTAWRTGLVVSLEYTGTELVRITPIAVESRNGVIGLQKDGALLERLALLSDQLGGPSYIEAVNAHVLRLWQTVYKTYYMNAFNTLDPARPLMQNVRAVLKFLLGKTKIDRSMLIHNMKIESHRFAILRALELESATSNRIH